MRYIALLTIVVLLFGTGVVIAQDGKVNFSGTWTLNAEKSDQGGGGREGGRGGRRGGMGGSASKMVVEQKDNKLVVETFRQNRDGDEVSTTATYTLDGKKIKTTNERGTTESKATWSEDGNILTIASVRNMSRGDRDFTIETTAKWSLDKEILTISTTRFSQRGDRTTKAVYDKAKK